MMINLIDKVKSKKQFIGLPDDVIERSFKKFSEGGSKESVKDVRRHLRKYFGVFLTNRVLKPKNIMDYKAVLKSHKSSTRRDYTVFYNKVRDGIDVDVVRSVIDLGSGVNGFSYPFLRKVFGDVRYIGVEASSQLVDNTNVFFDRSGFGKLGDVVHGDLFDVNFVNGILKSEDRIRLVFLFQVIDALENVEKNFSKKFLLTIKKNCEFIVLSMSMSSLSGKGLRVKRNWVFDFLKDNFEVLDEFELDGEMVFCLKC